GTPNLYRLKTTVYVNGELTETDEQFVGARELTFSHDEGLAINGHPVKLKGVCIHHDAGCLGSAVPRQVWYRRIKHLKEMGCNAIRTSHNPQASDLYDICDELGLVVIDEAFDEWEYPKKKWVKGWNVGTPTYDGNYDYFKEWGETDLKDMILRDRNHPSVIMWSIGNEVDYPNDPYSHPILDSIRISQPVYGGWLPGNPQAEQLSSLSRKLVDVVHRYDPTRPATAGLAGVAMSNHTDYPFNLDVCGYNYTESLYEKDHATYPERILYGSENSQDPQAWNVVRDSKYVFGQFIWTGIDYLGESGQWPSRGFYTGMLDFGGFLKTNGLYRQAMWSEKPVVNLTTAPLTGAHRRGAPLPGWNYKEGARIVVTCMGNTPYARLTLNGVEVGQPKAIDKDRYSTSWSIPYQKGTLTVEGLNEAKEVCCSSAVTTAGVPVRLTALPDVRVIEKERGVSQIELDVTDSQGVLVPSAKNEITCRIAGPVRLLGLENSNNADMSDYRDNRQCVYHGRLIAYIQATGQKGKATITFSSPSLKSTSIELDIN
ncbi:MAG: glycoside hydrolase family 2 TIM barrel-domain containing protein, partial [Bacteroidota bacterium]|nr:glycoside hydrolase family 2 TIM barrel-domain containing protein [Bacteroidota bacterium]